MKSRSEVARMTQAPLCDLLRSGQVRRWHSNPDLGECGENNAQHQWAVAMIAWRLKPDISRAGLLYALTHDAGELVAGDLGYEFKRDNPEFAAAHRAYEFAARERMLPAPADCPEGEADLVKLADWVSAWNTMCRYFPSLAIRDDWGRQAAEMLDLADRLGVSLAGVMAHYVE